LKELLLLPKTNKVIELGTPQSPDPGSRWIVIGGLLTHVTGTATALNIAEKGGTLNRQLIGFVDASEGNGDFPFPNRARAEDIGATNAFKGNADSPASYVPPIVTSNEQLAVSGDTGAGAYVSVLVLYER